MEYDRLSRITRAKSINSISWYKYNYLKEQENLNSFQEKNHKKYSEKNKNFNDVIDKKRKDKKENNSFRNEDEKKEILRDIMEDFDIYSCTLNEIRQVGLLLYENDFLNDEEKGYLDEIISIKEEEVLDECIEANSSALDFSILKDRHFNIINYIDEKAEGLIRIRLFLKSNKWKELSYKLNMYKKNNLAHDGMQLYSYRRFMINK